MITKITKPTAITSSATNKLRSLFFLLQRRIAAHVSVVLIERVFGIWPPANRATAALFCDLFAYPLAFFCRLAAIERLRLSQTRSLNELHPQRNSDILIQHLV